MNRIHFGDKQVIRDTLNERGVSPVDQEFIIGLFDSIMKSFDLDENLTSKDMTRIREKISEKLLSNQHLLVVLRQQTAELHTLRRLSLHFSSSLNLITILNTVVSDALELLENPRAAHIFLYDGENDLIQFGAVRDVDGANEKSSFEPHKNGLQLAIIGHLHIMLTLIAVAITLVVGRWLEITHFLQNTTSSGRPYLTSSSVSQLLSRVVILLYSDEY